MKAPYLKMMPNHSPPTRLTCIGVTFVSGPRTVTVVSPWYFDTTISHWLAATERKSPVRSLCVRQILSTKGESDSLSSKVKIMLFVRYRCIKKCRNHRDQP